MPELPEVETVRRGLEERIVGLRIGEVEVLCEKSFVGEAAEVVGRTVAGLRRYGKALIIDLSGGMSMMIHLRMTGQLIFDGEVGKEKRYAAGHPSENFVAELPNKQTRVIFRLEKGENEGSFGVLRARSELRLTGENANLEEKEELEAKGKRAGRERARETGRRAEETERLVEGKLAERGLAEGERAGTAGKLAGMLYFNDQRKFGFVKVLRTDEVEREPFVAKLAKEPWEMEEGEFYEALQRHRNSAIKAVILDQTVIAGLGNIYADEALFGAKIHPERKAGTVTRAEAARLLAAAREVMEKSIASGGSTMRTYVRADGTRGDYLEKFAQVFRKEGQPCPRCGAEIVKIRVAGRGTHICPRCQRKQS